MTLWPGPMNPSAPRRAAPNRRRWCAAACLCLVTATAVLLTARYLPLKDYKDGDTNYSPSQPITNYQIGVEACYKAPDPGEYFCFVEVNAARKQYAGRDVKFLLEMDVFQNGEQVAAGSLGGEFKRLAALGYDLRLVNLQEQDEDLIITWPIAVGLFTEEQIRNFPVNSEYGYAFRFPHQPRRYPRSNRGTQSHYRRRCLIIAAHRHPVHAIRAGTPRTQRPYLGAELLPYAPQGTRRAGRTGSSAPAK